MVDTARSLADMLAELESGSGVITRQRIRDLVVSIAQPLPGGGFDSGIWENVVDHGAVGDDATDNTDAFMAAADAAGYGGTIVAPLGIFRLSDFTPTLPVHIKGSGQNGGTVLKAMAGATWIVKFLGLFNASISDLTIDGNTRASSGVLCQGQDGVATSQMMRLEHINWIRCDTGVEFDATAIETDKNYIGNSRFDECLKGVRIHGENTQFTVLDSVYIGADVAVHLSGGTLWWRTGGQYNSVTPPSIGILMDSFSAIDHVLLQDVIMGDDTIGGIDVDGTDGWPQKGVVIESSILQSAIGVIVGGSSSKLTLRNMGFGNGGVRVQGDSTTVHEEWVEYLFGATYEIDGGVNNARYILANTSDIRGLAINGNAADLWGTKYGIQWGDEDDGALDTNLYRYKANHLKTDDKFLAELGLGVGNSEDATEVIGKAVVKKVQVFDEDGTAIGYIPVYSSIT